MNFLSFIKTKAGRRIFSVLLGLGFTALFYEKCKDKTCIRFVSPTTEQLKYSYKFNNQCYKYHLNASSCNLNKKQIPMFSS